MEVCRHSDILLKTAILQRSVKLMEAGCVPGSNDFVSHVHSWPGLGCQDTLTLLLLVNLSGLPCFLYCFFYLLFVLLPLEVPGLSLRSSVPITSLYLLLVSLILMA